MNNEKKRVSFAPGTLTAPLPPVIATVGDFDNANIITIGWTGILSSTPPRTYISVRPSRYSHGILKERGEFVINLPSVSLAREVDYCGIYTGAKVDKFEKCGLTKAKSEKVAPPTIAECPIALECRVCDVIEMGSHDVFIADIVSVSCREDIVEDGGRMRFDKADLLAYAHGEYYSLGEIVGRFGFSTDKVKRSADEEKRGRLADEMKPETKKKPKNPSEKKENSETKGSERTERKVSSRTDKKPFAKPEWKGKPKHSDEKKPVREAKRGGAYAEKPTFVYDDSRYEYEEDFSPRRARTKPADGAPFYKSVAKRTPQRSRSDKGAPHGKRGAKGSK